MRQKTIFVSYVLLSKLGLSKSGTSMPMWATSNAVTTAYCKSTDRISKTCGTNFHSVVSIARPHHPNAWLDWALSKKTFNNSTEENIHDRSEKPPENNSKFSTDLWYSLPLAHKRRPIINHSRCYWGTSRLTSRPGSPATEWDFPVAHRSTSATDKGQGHAQKAQLARPGPRTNAMEQELAQKVPFARPEWKVSDRVTEQTDNKKTSIWYQPPTDFSVNILMLAGLDLRNNICQWHLITGLDQQHCWSSRDNPACICCASPPMATLSTLQSAPALMKAACSTRMWWR